MDELLEVVGAAALVFAAALVAKKLRLGKAPIATADANAAGPSGAAPPPQATPIATPFPIIQTHVIDPLMFTLPVDGTGP